MEERQERRSPDSLGVFAPVVAHELLVADELVVLEQRIALLGVEVDERPQVEDRFPAHRAEGIDHTAVRTGEEPAQAVDVRHEVQRHGLGILGVPRIDEPVTLLGTEHRIRAQQVEDLLEPLLGRTRQPPATVVGHYQFAIRTGAFLRFGQPQGDGELSRACDAPFPIQRRELGGDPRRQCGECAADRAEVADEQVGGSGLQPWRVGDRFQQHGRDVLDQERPAEHLVAAESPLAG